MLKYKIDSVDELDDSIKGLYTEKDGAYVLGIDGLPDVSEYETRITQMDSKINELLDEKKTAARKAKEAEEEAKRVAEEAARKSGDIEALEKSWQEKFGSEKQQLMDQLEAERNRTKQLTVGNTAASKAGEWAVEGASDILEKAIRERLSLDTDSEGNPVQRVLDKNGKPSAMTLDELKDEFLSHPGFARIMAGSKATGGGASGNNFGGGAAGKSLKDMTPKEKSAFISEHGLEKFNSLVNKGK